MIITACDQFHYGENCAQTCNCGAGASTCDRVRGCLCMSGWTGTKCDQDINECSGNTNPCTGQNQVCVNKLGSYECRCATGYDNSTGTCAGRWQSYTFCYRITDVQFCTLFCTVFVLYTFVQSYTICYRTVLMYRIQKKFLDSES